VIKCGVVLGIRSRNYGKSCVGLRSLGKFEDMFVVGTLIASLQRLLLTP
jgi:hypothetical protein